MEICKQQSDATKGKWRYASSKARLTEMEICKQKSEIEMEWRYASSKARLKCAEICKQQSEIKMRHLPGDLNIQSIDM